LLWTVLGTKMPVGAQEMACSYVQAKVEEKGETGFPSLIVVL
jgi:hypothetical protein